MPNSIPTTIAGSYNKTEKKPNQILSLLSKISESNITRSTSIRDFGHIFYPFIQTSWQVLGKQIMIQIREHVSFDNIYISTNENFQEAYWNGDP
jgi:hypothetical protein